MLVNMANSLDARAVAFAGLNPNYRYVDRQADGAELCAAATRDLLQVGGSIRPLW